MKDVRWPALRVLHEAWGVPLGLLRQATGDVECALDIRAAAEGWRPGKAPPALLARICLAADREVEALMTTGADKMPAEKRAASLSALAKTLETIASVSNKIATAEERSSDNKKSNMDEAYADFEDGSVQDLDRRFEALLASLDDAAGDEDPTGAEGASGAPVSDRPMALPVAGETGSGSR